MREGYHLRLGLAYFWAVWTALARRQKKEGILDTNKKHSTGHETTDPAFFQEVE